MKKNILLFTKASKAKHNIDTHVLVYESNPSCTALAGTLVLIQT